MLKILYTFSIILMIYEDMWSYSINETTPICKVEGGRVHYFMQKNFLCKMALEEGNLPLKQNKNCVENHFFTVLF